jgi:divalent metal cation (Fe/Co/Zn/Cd) transporter
VDEIKKAILKINDIIAVSEVQVYYKDDGMIAAKVDIVLPPKLTIFEAHQIAGFVFYFMNLFCFLSIKFLSFFLNKQ